MSILTSLAMAWHSRRWYMKRIRMALRFRLVESGFACFLLGHQSHRITWNNKYYWRMSRKGRGRHRRYIHTKHHAGDYGRRCGRRLK